METQIGATERKLTDAQREELAILVGQLATAQSEADGAEKALVAAQKALNLAQGNANRFVNYCAREHGVLLGKDNWIFLQSELCFTQKPTTTPALPAPVAHLNGNGKGG